MNSLTRKIKKENLSLNYIANLNKWCKALNENLMSIEII